MREGESDVKANSISDLYLEPISLSLFNGKKRFLCEKNIRKMNHNLLDDFPAKHIFNVLCYYLTFKDN